MQIVFEISDEVLWSLEQYIATQIRVTNDPVTKAQIMTRLYPDAQFFLEDAIHQVILQIIKQYPPKSLRARLEAQAKAEDEIKEFARPKRVGGNGNGGEEKPFGVPEGADTATLAEQGLHRK